MPGFTLAPGASAPAVAAALSSMERDLGGLPDETLDRVMIVAGELAANAAEHSRTPVSVAWHVRSDGVDLDVIGAGASARAIEAATLPPGDAVRGRGLYLIRSLSTAVEARADDLRLRFDVAGLDH